MARMMGCCCQLFLWSARQGVVWLQGGSLVSTEGCCSVLLWSAQPVAVGCADWVQGQFSTGPARLDGPLVLFACRAHRPTEVLLPQVTNSPYTPTPHLTLATFRAVLRCGGWAGQRSGRRPSAAGLARCWQCRTRATGEGADLLERLVCLLFKHQSAISHHVCGTGSC